MSGTQRTTLVSSRSRSRSSRASARAPPPPDGGRCCSALDGGGGSLCRSRRWRWCPHWLPLCFLAMVCWYTNPTPWPTCGPCAPPKPRCARHRSPPAAPVLLRVRGFTAATVRRCQPWVAPRPRRCRAGRSHTMPQPRPPVVAAPEALRPASRVRRCRRRHRMRRLWVPLPPVRRRGLRWTTRWSECCPAAPRRPPTKSRRSCHRHRARRCGGGWSNTVASTAGPASAAQLAVVAAAAFSSGDQQHLVAAAPPLSPSSAAGGGAAVLPFR